MSESDDTKVGSIPSWQSRDSSSEPPDPSGLVQDPSSPSSPSSPFSKEGPQRDPQSDFHASRASLLNQAAKFLQEDDIRGAAIERKKAFLESKGLSNLEIEELLAISPSEDASSDDRKKERVKDLQTSRTQSSQNNGIIKGVKEPSTPKSMPSGDISRDIPPIITYPEFLVHNRKPLPLITIDRLLTTIYLAAGAATTIYGTSEYIVNPMVKVLSAARHSLFETANTNLQTLTEKLKQIVSLVPDTAASGNINLEETDDLSTLSDPAEVFHRSAATQTTPRLSRSLSSVPLQALDSTLPTTDQHLRLQTLHANLSDLLSSNDFQIDSSQRVKGHVNDLQNYLDSLAYGISMTPTGLHGDSWKDDEISKVKAEIRSVKGLLLSARNFPSSVGTKGRG